MPQSMGCCGPDGRRQQFGFSPEPTQPAKSSFETWSSIRPDTEVTDGSKVRPQKGATGKFHFNLVAGNGETVATSESYNSKDSAMKGVDAVRRAAAEAVVDDQTAN